MAQNLQQLKRRIKTANNISQIAKAMEMISASKIKRAQKAVENNKPYSARINEITSTILHYVDSENFSHPYLTQNNSPKSLYIVISTDKGLCGSLNTNLFKVLLEQDNKNMKLVTLGRRVRQFAQKLEAETIAEFGMGTALPEYFMVFQLIEIISREYLSGNVGSVHLMYNQFNSIFEQAPTTKKILPIETEHVDKELPYVFEPKAEEILDSLLPYYLEVVIYSALIEAFTSEQAARMVAMQNAKNNALDIAEYLTLIYNKSRQERITNELLALSTSN